jgi:hypothetical protein
LSEVLRCQRLLVTRGRHGTLKSFKAIFQAPPIEHQDIVAMSQAGYVAVDWGTSSFRLWLVDRAGGILGERRSLIWMPSAPRMSCRL